MAKNLQIMHCKLCGHLLEVIHEGAGELVCCNQAMTLLAENSTDAAQEKHVPVVTAVEGGYKVAVGSVAHPMTEEHFIEWIELIADNGKVYRENLCSDSAPEATFLLQAAEVTARAYCNLHGLWKS